MVKKSKNRHQITRSRIYCGLGSQKDTIFSVFRVRLSLKVELQEKSQNCFDSTSLEVVFSRGKVRELHYFF